MTDLALVSLETIPNISLVFKIQRITKESTNMGNSFLNERRKTLPVAVTVLTLDRLNILIDSYRAVGSVCTSRIAEVPACKLSVLIININCLNLHELEYTQ